MPCIKILLDRCSVLLLQETWLFSNQFTQFTKYFDKYKSINICGMDESIFCHGRPHGGCFIFYSNQYDVTPIYFKEKRRIVGIKISLCTSIFHIFNVYGRISQKWCQLSINHKTFHNLTSRPHMDKTICFSQRENSW